MRILEILSLGFLIFLLACQSGQQTNPSYDDSQPTQSPDVSRTTAVKNTPSRPLDQIESELIESTQTIVPVSTAIEENDNVPEGMIYVPGGSTDIGSATGLPREQPVYNTVFQPFYMDKTPVTVAQFRTFVEATGYITQAEGFGDAVVFDLDKREWELRPGANWKQPLGPNFEPAKDDHPVTQVSFNDAIAYCEWADKRLPTEAEWEHAARNASNSRNRYSWGEEITDHNGYKANIWQGTFPAINTGEDGYLFTCPVGTFGETSLGLSDISGNVWEWCQDWYLPYGSDQKGYEPNAESEKVMRGGSFMCDPNYCHGYRVSGRSGSTPETGLFHTGFRCVKDVK